MDPSSGSILNLCISLLLFAFSIFHSFRLSLPSRLTALRLPVIRWSLLFLGFSCCSLLWSATVSPISSFAYWLAVVAHLFAVILLVGKDTDAIISRQVMQGYIVATVFLALLAWIMPLEYDLRLGDIDYFNPNQIALLCALSIFFVQLLLRLGTRTSKVVTFFLAITLLRTLSKTTLIAFILAQLYLLACDPSIRKETKIRLLMVAVITLFVFSGLFVAYFDIYTTNGNQAETLTGRTAIWAYALEHGFEKPWIGNGMDSMWKQMPPLGPDRFEARHAENEFLQQFYAYGVVGVSILAAIYIALFRQIRTLGRDPLRFVCTSLLLFILIRGLAEAEPIDLQLPIWAIFLVSKTLLEAKAAPRHPEFDPMLSES